MTNNTSKLLPLETILTEYRPASYLSWPEYGFHLTAREKLLIKDLVSELILGGGFIEPIEVMEELTVTHPEGGEYVYIPKRVVDGHLRIMAHFLVNPSAQVLVNISTWEYTGDTENSTLNDRINAVLDEQHESLSVAVTFSQTLNPALVADLNRSLSWRTASGNRPWLRADTFTVVHSSKETVLFKVVGGSPATVNLSEVKAEIQSRLNQVVECTVTEVKWSK